MLDAKMRCHKSVLSSDIVEEGDLGERTNV